MSPYQRDHPPPPEERTIHFVGDAHFGGMNARRKGVLLSDVERLDGLRRIPRVQVGDLTNDGFAAQDTEAVAFMNSLGPGWRAVAGNHDVWNNARTPAAAASAWGMPGVNWTLDVGFCVVVGIGPTLLGANNADMTLDAAYLDARLAEHAGRTCVVVGHPPLKNTVGIGSTTEWTSADQGFFVQNDAAVRDVLALRPNAKAWVSGHTHSTLAAPDLVKRESVKAGAHHLAAVNCSSPFYTTKNNILWTDVPSTCYVTVLDGSIEVRYRDHGAHRWTRAVRVPL